MKSDRVFNLSYAQKGADQGGGGGGVVLEGTRGKIGWVRGQLPKPLTLFMTKICDFPYPINELTKNSWPYLSPDLHVHSCRETWLFYEGLLVMVLSIIMKQ